MIVTLPGTSYDYYTYWDLLLICDTSHGLAMIVTLPGGLYDYGTSWGFVLI